MTTKSELTPAQRTLRAQIGAYALHSQHDGAEITAAARHASQVTRFERQVDPNRELSEEERARRVEHARAAYMRSLALASSRARAARKAAKEETITARI